MAPSSWRVAQIRADGENEIAEIPPEGLTFGRSESCDFVLDSAEFPGVSSDHARVILDGDSLVLEDANSRNGTLVHGQNVERYELSHGSVFQLGNGGPRFVVYSSDRLDETVTLPKPALKKQHDRTMGSQTMFVLRSKLGIPKDTAKSRLRRATDRLRERLDQRCGDRQIWLGALVPLLRPTPLSTLLPVAWTMKATLQGTAALALIARGVWTLPNLLSSPEQGMVP